MNEDIKKISDMLEVKSSVEAAYYPIDRFFLNQYINQIIKLNRNDFLLYNIEKINNNYSIDLMLCLPELWNDIDFEDLVWLMNNFTNSYSFYTFIEFTYKYVEIDILDIAIPLYFRASQKHGFDMHLKEYLRNLYPNFIKTETDFLFFEEDVWGVKNDDWIYIKQKLLLDKRIKPALKSVNELYHYINTYLDNG